VVDAPPSEDAGISCCPQSAVIVVQQDVSPTDVVEEQTGKSAKTLPLDQEIVL
jgi:hypothetical protein